jgi:hypothetical protein
VGSKEKETETSDGGAPARLLLLVVGRAAVPGRLSLAPVAVAPLLADAADGTRFCERDSGLFVAAPRRLRALAAADAASFCSSEAPKNESLAPAAAAAAGAAEAALPPSFFAAAMARERSCAAV